jgi:serine/threonine protein kinase
MAERLTLAGRYELATPIGSGGMGQVWSGFDKRLDRPVAVKLLRPDTLPAAPAEREIAAKRFAREARLTARIEHPGVPAVFDAGVDNQRLYIVMQLVPGVDLVNFLAQHHPLPVTWAVAVAAQIASVLAAAHDESLVHRDLKPSNIMVRPDGTVVVLDFGVAAWLRPDISRLTGPGETIGSPAYMSPEQVLNGSASPRSDLYALGCLMYELLAGARPFTGDGTYLVMRQHVEEPPPHVRSVRPEVPAELEELILQLMAKEPEDRPADAQEVHDRLRPLLPMPGGPEDRYGTSDPTRPYREPLAPRRRTTRRPVTRTSTSVGDIAKVRDEAAQLATAGRYSQAAEMLANLLAARKLGPHPRELRGVRLQLANTLLLGGDYARALSEYELLVAEVAPERAVDDEDVLHWRLQIASCHAALGRPQEALIELEPVLAVKRRQKGPRDTAVVDLRQQAATLLALTGRKDAAIAEVCSLLDDLGSRDPRSGGLRALLNRLTGGSAIDQ